MRLPVACWIVASLPAVALARPIEPVEPRLARVDLSTTFVSGPVTPEAWNPMLRIGLGGSIGAQVDRFDFRGSWGLYRDQAGCDTCGDGKGPGAVGRELLGSTDLSLTFGHRTTVKDATFRVAFDLVLPASRDALVCNPMYGAPGVSASLFVPVDAGAVRLSARASRPLYRYDSVPVGLCSPRLADPLTDTLTGPVAPTPWGGIRPGMANPSATGGLAATWLDPHALLLDAERLFTGVSVGIDASRQVAADPVTVRTETGPVRLDGARSPVVAAFPWSLTAGVSVSDYTDLSLSVSDRVPALLTDPGGTLRALPGRTAITLTLSGSL